MKKLPSNTEVALILVGQMPFVQQPIIGFFRLHRSTILHEMTEVELSTRFIFICMGPMTLSIYEIEDFGRAMSMLLTDKVWNAFRITLLTDKVYNAFHNYYFTN